MGLYLTIPDMVESEPLLSLSPSSDGLSFAVMLEASETAVRLMHAAAEGQRIPLVVLTTDAQILALDDVYVTDAISSSTQPPVMSLTFAATAVRFV
jgi:hypothetical protein